MDCGWSSLWWVAVASASLTHHFASRWRNMHSRWPSGHAHSTFAAAREAQGENAVVCERTRGAGHGPGRTGTATQTSFLLHLMAHRVAVGGGTGFVGRALVAALRQRGDEVRSLLPEPTSSPPTNLPDLLPPPTLPLPPASWGWRTGIGHLATRRPRHCHVGRHCRRHGSGRLHSGLLQDR